MESRGGGGVSRALERPVSLQGLLRTGLRRRCGCLQDKGQGCLSECQGCCRRLLKSSVEEWSLGCVMGSLSHTVHPLCSREVPFMSSVAGQHLLRYAAWSCTNSEQQP